MTSSVAVFLSLLLPLTLVCPLLADSASRNIHGHGGVDLLYLRKHIVLFSGSPRRTAALRA